ncbi:MAG: rRNA maturation RNase YbeY [Mycoplasmataceae bacterium]|jgi:probable rRNA maturation factor|nr:rRNA maturation RNase YbeY [Mycoplasmataceae bacterium]
MFKFIVNDPHQVVSRQLTSLFKKANKLISGLNKQDSIYDLVIANNQEIKMINNQYRHINKPTDVISFALHDAASIKTNLIGEIYINYQMATNPKNTFEFEMVFLFIHGLLHLLGYDHQRKQKEKEMFALQNKLMKQLNLLK